MNITFLPLKEKQKPQFCSFKIMDFKSDDRLLILIQTNILSLLYINVCSHPPVVWKLMVIVNILKCLSKQLPIKIHDQFVKSHLEYYCVIYSIPVITKAQYAGEMSSKDILSSSRSNNNRYIEVYFFLSLDNREAHEEEYELNDQCYTKFYVTWPSQFGSDILISMQV